MESGRGVRWFSRRTDATRNPEEGLAPLPARLSRLGEDAGLHKRNRTGVAGVTRLFAVLVTGEDMH